MSTIYAPGCALMLYKPHLARRVTQALGAALGPMEQLLTCCHHEDGLPPGTVIINTCSGCDRRYRHRREDLRTVSLWEVIAALPDFPYPDYGGQHISIHDACPTRTRPELHAAVRTLLTRMNLNIQEAQRIGTEQVCCGDSYYPAKPLEEIHRRMRDRAAQMPADDVCVYCVSCVKAMALGGKRPRYLVDLLFGEDTLPGDCDTTRWHERVDQFIESH